MKTEMKWKNLGPSAFGLRFLVCYHFLQKFGHIVFIYKTSVYQHGFLSDALYLEAAFLVETPCGFIVAFHRQFQTGNARFFCPSLRLLKKSRANSSAAVSP